MMCHANGRAALLATERMAETRHLRLTVTLYPTQEEAGKKPTDL